MLSAIHKPDHRGYASCKQCPLLRVGSTVSASLEETGISPVVGVPGRIARQPAIAIKRQAVGASPMRISGVIVIGVASGASSFRVIAETLQIAAPIGLKVRLVQK